MFDAIKQFFYTGPKKYTLAQRALLMQEARQEALAQAAALEAEIADTRDDLTNAMLRLSHREVSHLQYHPDEMERDLSKLTAVKSS